MNPPLAGIGVLDIGTLTPGKFCTAMLADMGSAQIEQFVNRLTGRVLGRPSNRPTRDRLTRHRASRPPSP